MKRSLLLSLASVLFLAATVSPALAIPDEQKSRPNPPVAGVGGYSGVYYDDQSTLQRAFTYIEAWTIPTASFTENITCASATTSPCDSAELISYETALSPCSEARTLDCVAEIAAGKTGDSLVAGQLISLVTPSFSSIRTQDLAKYWTPFTGDLSRGIPSSGLPSLWRFSGITHEGGEDFLLIPKLVGNRMGKGGNPGSSLDVGIFPVSSIPKSTQGCFLETSETTCLTRWPFPSSTDFKVKIRTTSNLIGWLYGRLTNPDISTSVLSDGQLEVSISGSPISVPIVATWAKNSDLPPALDASLESEFNFRGQKFAGTCFFGCESKSRSDQTVLEDRNPSFDGADYFDRYLLWVKIAEDRAYANHSTWSFRSIENFAQYEKCLTSKGLAGIVTTNSNAYLSGPPVFDGVDLNYRVASPHYDSKGELQIGTYDMAIRSDVARCIYKFTDAPIQASLSIVYADGGESQKATTVVAEKGGWITLSAKGFTYSSPTMKVSMSQEKSPAVASEKPMKKTISCAKGSKTKKVTGTKPKCPKGYKKA